MKKIANLIICSLFAMAIAGCGSSPESQVSNSMKRYFEILISGDGKDLVNFVENTGYDTPSHFNEKNAQRMIDMQQPKLVRMSGGGVKSVEVLDMDTEREVANIKVTFENDETETEQYQITQINEKWVWDLTSSI